MSSIRVLHTFKRYLPTTQNWAFRLIESLPAADVHIYAQRFEKKNFYPASWRYVDFGIPNIDAFYKEIGTSGVDILYKILLRASLPWLKKKRLNLLRQYVAKNEIDIVHSHFGPFGCIVGEALKGTKVRHVVSFYGFDYEQLPFQQPAYFTRYKRLFREAAALVCEGSHGARTLVKMGCPPEKVHVVHLGIDADRISLAKRRKEPGQLNLVQIASLTEKKGHYYTIRAFLRALHSAPNMTLTIVGSARAGKDELILQDINEQVRIHGVTDKVTIIPRIDFKLLYEFLNDFDVFIHPSCYASDMDSEGGAPVVLLDAQATGMPVISTAHCDIPDEVIHGETGLLSPEKNVEALTENILKFYHMNAEEYGSFSTKARDHVAANYDITKSGVGLRSVYEGLLH